jgi:hypothetical protein
MDYDCPDRVPYFEEGIRDDVIEVWRNHGLDSVMSLRQLFPTDIREEKYLDVDPHPYPKKWPSSEKDLREFQKRLDPHDLSRFPDDWVRRSHEWRSRTHVLMLRVHQGLFQSLGIEDWHRFADVMFLFTERPNFVKEYMRIQSQFTARLVEIALEQVEIDAAIFSEPIGGNHGPLISPEMYEEFALENYLPILAVLEQNNVRWVIVRTYANARVLIPKMLEYGFNCLWACEVNTESMDYRDLRSCFGKDLRLIGGIDLDILREDKVAIKRELEKIVPNLVADGGYIPLADGRVRADIPFENYVYYRQLLSDLTEI